MFPLSDPFVGIVLIVTLALAYAVFEPFGNKRIPVMPTARYRFWGWVRLFSIAPLLLVFGLAPGTSRLWWMFWLTFSSALNWFAWSRREAFRDSGA